MIQNEHRFKEPNFATHSSSCKEEPAKIPTQTVSSTHIPPPTEAPDPNHRQLFPKRPWRSPCVTEEKRYLLDFVLLLESADALTANAAAAGFISLAQRPIGNGSIQGKVRRTGAK